MSDYIILGILVAVVSGAIGYVVKQKKSGAKCIGCPHSKDCCGCSCATDKKR